MANEVIQHDFASNKTIIRDFTSEEKLLHEAKIKENESIIEAKKIKESNKTSGINKLKALGLTDDEINELIGMT
jgi:hypothetical protein